MSKKIEYRRINLDEITAVIGAENSELSSVIYRFLSDTDFNFVAAEAQLKIAADACKEWANNAKSDGEPAMEQKNRELYEKFKLCREKLKVIFRVLYQQPEDAEIGPVDHLI